MLDHITVVCYLLHISLSVWYAKSWYYELIWDGCNCSVLFKVKHTCTKTTPCDKHKLDKHEIHIAWPHQHTMILLPIDTRPWVLYKCYLNTTAHETKMWIRCKHVTCASWSDDMKWLMGIVVLCHIHHSHDTSIKVTNSKWWRNLEMHQSHLKCL